LCGLFWLVICHIFLISSLNYSKNKLNFPYRYGQKDKKTIKLDQPLTPQK